MYFSRMVVILSVMPRRIAGQQRRSGDAPGWYPDETDPGLERYFNGGLWTGSTRTAHNPAGVNGNAPMPELVRDRRMLAGDLGRETVDRARVLYRWADIFGVLVTVLAALAYLGCAGLAVGVRTPAAVVEAIGGALGVTAWLAAGLLLSAWAKTYAVDTQRRSS